MGRGSPATSRTPLVVVDGPSQAFTGLVLGGAPAAGGSTIQGLAVVNFGAYGIAVLGSSDHILDNYVGTSDGITAAPNENGLLVDSTSDHTEIRGNLISGNDDSGIDLDGTDNFVHGNRIGTDAAGGTELANGGAGIIVTGGTNQRIGSDTPGGRQRHQRQRRTWHRGPFRGRSASRQTGSGPMPPGTSAVGNARRHRGRRRRCVGIGGTVPGMGNQISGNFGNGITFP